MHCYLNVESRYIIYSQVGRKYVIIMWMCAQTLKM